MAFNGSDSNYWQCDYNGTSSDINKKYPRHINYIFSITIPNPSEGFESVIDKISNNYDYFLSFNISCFDYFTAFIELDIDYRIYLF
jgi:hypothetical protein